MDLGGECLRGRRVGGGGDNRAVCGDGGWHVRRVGKRRAPRRKSVAAVTREPCEREETRRLARLSPAPTQSHQRHWVVPAVRRRAQWGRVTDTFIPALSEKLFFKLHNRA